MLDWFFKRKDKPVRLTEFDHIMGFAQALAKSNPAALIDLVRILLRPLQSELLLTAIENEMHGARHEIEDYKFFMPNGPSQIQMVFDCPRLDSDKFLVQLNRDPVLPCPWKRTDYVKTLSLIGKNKHLGDWIEDPVNHSVTVWLPWGIAFVHGGNHSIAAGIVGGEGVLRPKEVYDMGRLLDLVHCDGRHYRSKQDGQVLDTVHDGKIAALFEVGRLMRHHGITPMQVNSLDALKTQTMTAWQSPGRD